MGLWINFSSFRHDYVRNIEFFYHLYHPKHVSSLTQLKTVKTKIAKNEEKNSKIQQRKYFKIYDIKKTKWSSQVIFTAFTWAELNDDVNINKDVPSFFLLLLSLFAHWNTCKCNWKKFFFSLNAKLIREIEFIFHHQHQHFTTIEKRDSLLYNVLFFLNLKLFFCSHIFSFISFIHRIIQRKFNKTHSTLDNIVSEQ